MQQVASLLTIEELVAHVRAVLCGHDQLDPEQAPLTHSTIVRSGKTCGLFFHLQGPRNVKTYAIWTGQEQRILFYDSHGVRFAESRLSEGPDPSQLSDPATRHRARPSAA